MPNSRVTRGLAYIDVWDKHRGDKGYLTYIDFIHAVDEVVDYIKEQEKKKDLMKRKEKK